MPLISAAICPHPPLLVPEIAGAAAGELDALRAACDEAVSRVIMRSFDERSLDHGEGGVDSLVVVGGGSATRAYGADAAGSFAPYGFGLTVGDGEPVLPLSLTIGRWLLGRRTTPMDVGFQEVARDASPEECLELGARLAGSADRVALLVLGDGSACRGEKSPGYQDERAGPYDAEVARALGDADAGALAALDPVLSRELLAAGRAAWQVLAGAAGETRLRGALLADEAPYGVGYLVASWTR